MELWTNPLCSKSRSAEQILTDKGIPFTTRRYLDDPPSREEIQAVMDMLDDPSSIARPGVEGDVLQRLSEDSNLIERPIAIHNGRATVARPPEKVLELL